MMEGMHALLDGIDHIGASWMLGGSVGAMCYSEPRSTLDVDCMLSLEQKHVDRIVESFPENDFYVPPVSVLAHEIRRGAAGSFSIIHLASGFKADCYPCGQDELMHWILLRIARLPVGGRLTPVAPPEYIISMKLRFFAMSGQDKHLRDIRSIVRLLPELDVSVVTQWASRYGVSDAWMLARTLR